MLRAVAATLEHLPTDDAHRRLLCIHLEEGARLAAAQPEHAAFQLTLLVHAALTGEEDAALPLAACHALVYLGADLLDNVADDELPAIWDGFGQGPASLAATTLLCVATRAALERLDTPAETKWALSRSLDHGLLEMSAGQRADLAGAEVTPAGARAVAERKAGAEFGLFARGAAILAGGDAGAFGAFGRAFGAGAQIASDLATLFDPDSEDLVNGRCTLPVAHLLARNPERAALVESARTDPDARERLREALLAHGSIRFAVLVVEVYRRRAMAVAPLTEELQALLDAATALRLAPASAA